MGVSEQPDAVEKLVRGARPDEVGMRRALAVVQDRLFTGARRPTISRYVVLERIATGGMGIVYAAYDPELDRRVALKLVHTSSTHDPAQRERLIREAQSAARIAHPNVVSVFDAGTYLERELVGEMADDETPGVFMVMELVEGEDLSAWLGEGPHPWGQVVDRFAQAARGLAAAHREGMVHRDFKPANVMVDSDGRVRVMDFGLARGAGVKPEPVHEQAGPERSPRPRSLDGLTRTGATLGTPLYMSPEQHAREPVDARSDQFSFCVALYEALFHKSPFGGDTVEALAAAKEAGRIEAEPESTRVPQYLRQGIRRGLAPDPAARFESLEPLIELLERDPNAGRRRFFAGAGVVALVAGLVSGQYAWEAHRERQCVPDPSILAGSWDPEVREARRAAYLASGVASAPDAWRFVEREMDAYADGLIESLGENCRAGLESIQSAEITARRASCLDDRATELRVLSEILEDTRGFTIRRAPFVVGELTPISDCSVATISRIQYERPSAEEIKAVYRTRMLTALAQHDEAIAEADRALTHATSRDSAVGIARATFMKGRAVRYAGGRPAEALELLERAVQLAERAGDESTALWAGQEVVTALSKDPANAAEIERMLNRLIARAEHLEFGAPYISRVYYLLGKALRQQERHEEAAQAYLRSYELREQYLGPHPATANSLLSVGDEYQALARHDEAAGYYRRGLEIRERALGPDHPMTGRALFRLAIATWSSGGREEAVRMAKRALDVVSDAKGEEAPETVRIQLWLDSPQHEAALPPPNSG